MASSTKTFHNRPLLRELENLRATESTLGRHYSRLRRAKNPRRTAILQFVTELVRLQLRLEGLNRTLNAMAQIASSS
jgi:hypothetical protein